MSTDAVLCWCPVSVTDMFRPKRKVDPSAPSYITQPWKIIELVTAQGKDKMDESVHAGGGGEDGNSEQSKAAQKNPLLQEQDV